MDARINIPTPVNEPILPYSPGRTHRENLKAALKELRGEVQDIPMVIGGKKVKSKKLIDQVCPHDHDRCLTQNL